MDKRNSGLNAAFDELLNGKKTEDMVGPKGLLKQLTKALLERAGKTQFTQNSEHHHHHRKRFRTTLKNGELLKQVETNASHLQA